MRVLVVALLGAVLIPAALSAPAQAKAPAVQDHQDLL